jgi:hypothetical protein
VSRNLCSTTCAFCDGKVRLNEPARPITQEEAGGYFREFEGMLVARSACVDCEAPYLAWVDMRTCVGSPHAGRRDAQSSGERTHFDLSHYHSFNDEPALGDMPKYRIEVIVTRTRYEWPTCDRCDSPCCVDGRCYDYDCRNAAVAEARS